MYFNSGISGGGNIKVSDIKVFINGSLANYSGRFEIASGSVIFSSSHFVSGQLLIEGGNAEFGGAWRGGVMAGALRVNVGTLTMSVVDGYDEFNGAVSGNGLIKKLGAAHDVKFSGDGSAFTGVYEQSGSASSTTILGSWAAINKIRSGKIYIGQSNPLAAEQTVNAFELGSGANLAGLIFSGSNKITVSSSIVSAAGAAAANVSIDKYGTGVLELKGDNSGFKGSVRLHEGRTILSNKFFGSVNPTSVVVFGSAIVEFATGSFMPQSSQLELRQQSVLELTTPDDLHFEDAIAGDNTIGTRINKYSTGTLTLTGTNSAFKGIFTQTAGKTIFGDGTEDGSESGFGGLNVLTNSLLIVKNAGGLNYRVELGAGARLEHYAQAGSENNITPGRAVFTNSGGEIYFGNANPASPDKPKYNLSQDIMNNDYPNNKVVFATAVISFVRVAPASNFSLSLNGYKFYNSDYDLRNAAGFGGSTRTIRLTGDMGANAVINTDGYISKLSFGFGYDFSEGLNDSDRMRGDRLITDTRPEASQLFVDLGEASSYIDDRVDNEDLPSSYESVVYYIPVLNSGGLFKFSESAYAVAQGIHYQYVVKYFSPTTLQIEALYYESDNLYLNSINAVAAGARKGGSASDPFIINWDGVNGHQPIRNITSSGVYSVTVLYSSTTFEDFYLEGDGGGPENRVLSAAFARDRGPSRQNRTSLFVLSEVDGGRSLHITSLTVRNAYIKKESEEGGQILLNEGNGSVVRLLSANSYAYFSDVILYNNQSWGSTVAARGTSGYGGAIYALAGSMTFRSEGYSSRFESNFAQASGGAIYMSNARALFETFNGKAMVFRSNHAPIGSGGAIYMTNSTAVFRGAFNFRSNESATGYAGGAIALINSSATFIVSLANDTPNVADMDRLSLKFNDNRVSGPQSDILGIGGGGAIYIGAGSYLMLAVENGEAVFRDNVAIYGQGGAILNMGKLDIEVKAGKLLFENNFIGSAIMALGRLNDIHNTGTINAGAAVGSEIEIKGVISGDGTINKLGGGRLILGDGSLYTGDMNIEAGMVQARGAYLSGNTFIKSGGRLEFSAGSVFGGLMDIGSGGTLAIMPGAGELRANKIDQLSGGGLIEKDNADTFFLSAPFENFTGTFTQRAGQTIINSSFYASSITIAGSDFRIYDGTEFSADAKIYLVKGATMTVRSNDMVLTLLGSVIASPDSAFRKEGSAGMVIEGDYSDFNGIFIQNGISGSRTTIKDAFNARGFEINGGILEILVESAWTPSNEIIGYIKLAGGSELEISGAADQSIRFGGLVSGSADAFINKDSGLKAIFDGGGSGFRGKFVQTAGTTVFNNAYFAGESFISGSLIELSSNAAAVSGDMYLSNGAKILVTDNYGSSIVFRGSLTADESALIEKVNERVLGFSGLADRFDGRLDLRAGTTTISSAFGSAKSRITVYTSTLNLIGGALLSGSIDLHGGSGLIAGAGQVVLSSSVKGVLGAGISVEDGGRLVLLGNNEHYLGAVNVQSDSKIVVSGRSVFFGGLTTIESGAFVIVDTNEIVKFRAGNVDGSGRVEVLRGTLEYTAPVYFANTIETHINGGMLKIARSLEIGGAFCGTSGQIRISNAGVGFSGNLIGFSGLFVIENGSAVIKGATYFKDGATEIMAGSTLAFSRAGSIDADNRIYGLGVLESRADLSLTGDMGGFEGAYFVNGAASKIRFDNGRYSRAVALKGAGSIVIEDGSALELSGRQGGFTGKIDVDGGARLIAKTLQINASEINVSAHSTMSTIYAGKVSASSVAIAGTLNMSGTWQGGINLGGNQIDRVYAQEINIDANAVYDAVFYGGRDVLRGKVVIMESEDDVVGQFKGAKRTMVSDGVSWTYQTATNGKTVQLTAEGNLMAPDQMKNYFGADVKDLSRNERVIYDRMKAAVEAYNKDMASGASRASSYYEGLADSGQMALWNKMRAGDKEGIKKLLSDLSGSFYANILGFGAQARNVDALYARINDITTDEVSAPWGMLNFVSSPKAGDEESPEDIKNSGTSMQGGMNLFRNENIAAGGFMSLGKYGIKQGSNRADITAIEFGGYGSYYFTPETLAKGYMSFSNESFAARREIDVDGRMVFKSNFNTNSIKFGADGWHKLAELGGNSVRGFGGINGGLTFNGEIKEKAIDGDERLAATVPASSMMKFNMRLGGQIDGAFGLSDWAAKLNWYAKIYANILLLGSRPEYDISDSDAKIYGAQERVLTFNTAFGANKQVSEKVSVSADIALAAGSKLGYSLSLGAKYKF
jgi:autotransporter-associated beta strand protein